MVAGGFGFFGVLSLLGGRSASAATSSGGRKVKANMMGAKRVLPLVVKWAKVFGTPPSLMMAVIENESGFDANNTNLTSPGDVARGGAWGLGQITLKTAQSLYAGAKGKVPPWDGTGKGLYDPELNVALTAYGLGLNWKRYRNKPNNWLAAGLAWNVGAGAVDKHLDTPSWIVGHPYAQHIAGYRNTNPVTAELFSQEKDRFAYA